MTAVTNVIKNMLNKMTPGALKCQLGTILQNVVAGLNTHEALPHVLQARVTATQTEINAGKELIAAVTGKKIRIISYRMLVTGAFDTGGGTNITIQDSNTSPVVVTTALKAALTDGAIIGSDATISNVTNGAGMTADLTTSKALKVAASGTHTNGTSITFIIAYALI